MNHNRGHPIEYKGCWRYIDTREPVGKTRPCGLCGQEATEEGHDPCLGTLPDVLNACCGHGQKGDAYISYEPFQHIGEEEAFEFFRKMGVGPPGMDK